MQGLDELILGCEEAGEFLLQAWKQGHFQDDSLIKDRDLKLGIDILAENKILKHLEPYNLSCYTEERGWIGAKDSNYVLIDGLDGTVNFANNLPIFSVSAAIMRGSKAVAGVVVDPLNQKTLTRHSNGPLLINRKYHKMVKQNKTRIESLLLSAITPTFFDDTNNTSRHLNLLRGFGKVRMAGSAAWSVAMLAEGNIDAVYFPDIYRWDVMGGVALLGDDNFEVLIDDNSYDKDLCTLYAKGKWVSD